MRVDKCPVTPYNVGPKLREGPVGSLVEVTSTLLVGLFCLYSGSLLTVGSLVEVTSTLRVLSLV
jgi:hypothetical protein